MQTKSKDEKFMCMALELAGRGLGATHPNPPVGAVLVKANKVAGRGFHRRAGGDHAEIVALNKAGKKASAAILYATLEPCVHYGKTPPCVDAIVKAKVKRAVIATKDPNPRVTGRGIRALEAAGIKVEVGVMENEARDLNRYFAKFITKGMPFVTLKMAQTLDGKIADSKGRSKWISSRESREYVHRLRSEHDAVMIGAGTFIKDDPLLTNRLYKDDSGRNPIRIILDTHLKSPLTHRMWKDRTGGEIIVAAGEGVSARKRRLFVQKGARVLTIKETRDGLNLRSLMQRLANRGITSVLAEGGGELAFSLIRERLVDEAIIFISSRILGGRKAPTSFEGEGFSTIAAASWLKDTTVENLGSDMLVKGKL